MAANDFIRIDQSTTTATNASDLKQAIDTLRNCINQWEKIYGLMTHMTDGTTFTTLETQFGLAAGKGAVVYNLVTVSRAKIRDGASTLTIVDQVG